MMLKQSNTLLLKGNVTYVHNELILSKGHYPHVALRSFHLAAPAPAPALPPAAFPSDALLPLVGSVAWATMRGSGVRVRDSRYCY